MTDTDILANIPIKFRPMKRARRLTLRFDPITRHAVVTHPPRMSRRMVSAFVAEKTPWLHEQVQTLIPPTFLTHGACIPLLGVPHHIQIQPYGRRSITACEGLIRVVGPTLSPDCRLRDWLRRRAVSECESRARDMASQLGVSYRRLTVRDVKSRWGSCSGTGHLCFSWRLVFAPEAVLSYVVAHEVAHLVEMNHSSRFWDLVTTLVGPIDAEKKWLKDQGHTLHAYDPVG